MTAFPTTATTLAAAPLATDAALLNPPKGWGPVELESLQRVLHQHLAERQRLQGVLLSTLQNLTSGVLGIGHDGVIIVANPAACTMLGCELRQLAGQGIERVLLGVPGCGELLAALAGLPGGRAQIEWLRGGHDGLGNEGQTLRLSAVRALPPEDATPLAGLLLIEDLTQLRRLEQQAALRSRLTGMGEIATNLAHEIRNPLGSLALLGSVLARELEGDEELGPLAAQIVAGVQSLEHVVANTLSFARPRRVALTRVSLRRVLAETLQFLRHPLEQQQVEVVFDHDLQPEGWIAGDAEQLRQVFLNLVLNAMQAMMEGGRLELAIRALPEGTPGGGGYEVIVRDDGVGIPEELLTRIFDPFFTTREKGSGIGLAVVHAILTAHGAQIEARSRVAAGTTFAIRFPEA